MHRDCGDRSTATIYAHDGKSHNFIFAGISCAVPITNGQPKNSLDAIKLLFVAAKNSTLAKWIRRAALLLSDSVATHSKYQKSVHLVH